MIKPALPQETVPVVADPRLDGYLTHIVPGFFTAIPLELQRFFFGALM
jgi:hypothetical protein